LIDIIERKYGGNKVEIWPTAEIGRIDIGGYLPAAHSRQEVWININIGKDKVLDIVERKNHLQLE